MISEAGFEKIHHIFEWLCFLVFENLTNQSQKANKFTSFIYENVRRCLKIQDEFSAFKSEKDQVQTQDSQDVPQRTLTSVLDEEVHEDIRGVNELILYENLLSILFQNLT